MLKAPHSLATVFVNPITPALAYKQQHDMQLTITCEWVSTAVDLRELPRIGTHMTIGLQVGRNGQAGMEWQAGTNATGTLKATSHVFLLWTLLAVCLPFVA